MQPADRARDAVAALGWMAWARDRAASGARRPFELRCESRLGPDPCAGGARKVLASMKLESTFIISPEESDGGRVWRLSVMPSGPGQLVWDVRVRTSPGNRQAITMIWSVPAPF